MIRYEILMVSNDMHNLKNLLSKLYKIKIYKYQINILIIETLKKSFYLLKLFL